MDAVADVEALPGRITVEDRVYDKIAEYTAAMTIGVPQRSASVEVVQFRDGVVLRVRAPLPVPSLDDRADIDAGSTVFDRVAEIQDELRDRIGEITGRDVVRVDVTVTGAVIARKRRVR